MMTPMVHVRQGSRISIKPILIALALVGLALVIAGEAQIGESPRAEMHGLAIAIWGLVVAAWLLDSRHIGVGAWVVSFGLLILILVSHLLLHAEGLLALVVIPMTVLVAATGLTAALALSGVATLAYALLAWQASDPRVFGAVAVASVALWGTFLALAALHTQVMQLDRWLTGHLQQVTSLVEESRDRRAELAQALDDLTHLNRQMALMTHRQVALRQAAEQAERAKAAFVAQVSHEFRTPLNIIIGMIDLMVGGDGLGPDGIPDVTMGHLRVVHRNCRHLASMVDDVLDLSRVEADRMALHRTWVDMQELVSTAARVVEPLMVQKGLEWRLDCPGGLPLVYCDRIRMRQVVLNLLSNAARATSSGGIVLRLELRGEAMRLSVTDTGPGIPAELAEAIFEPFVQGSQATDQRDRGGSGLGLSVSKQFVEMHGGRMWVDSEVGKGTTFYVDLPLHPQEDHQARPGYQIREEWIWFERSSRPQLQAAQFRPRVLLCDATGGLGPALSQLTDEIEFLTVPDLASAIDEAHRFPVSALIVNEILPEKLLAAIEGATEAAPDTLVIGWSCPPRLERAKELGALGYLVKPVQRSDLARVLGTLPSPVERVLVIEDDPDTQELMQMMLHAIDDGIQVTMAGSSREALAQMRSQAPDLAFVDIVLPDMDGWQLLSQMRGDDTLRHIPTLVVSGQDPPEEAVGSRWICAAVHTPVGLHRLFTCSLRLMETLALSAAEPE